MFDAAALRGVVIVAGHYGVGKTNLTLNLCVDAARAGAKVTCVDLDIVNPYFRSSDYAKVLEDAGVFKCDEAGQAAFREFVKTVNGE